MIVWPRSRATCTTSARTWSTSSSPTTATRSYNLGIKQPITAILRCLSRSTGGCDRPLGAAGQERCGDAGEPRGDEGARTRGAGHPGRRGPHPGLRRGDVARRLPTHPLWKRRLRGPSFHGSGLDRPHRRARQGDCGARRTRRGTSAARGAGGRGRRIPRRGRWEKPRRWVGHPSRTDPERRREGRDRAPPSLLGRSRGRESRSRRDLSLHQQDRSLPRAVAVPQARALAGEAR